MKNPQLYISSLHAKGLAVLVVFVSACNAVPQGSAGASNNTSTTPAVTSTTTQVQGTSAPSVRSYATGALVFNGSGVWQTETTALEGILSSHGLSFQEVNDAQINAMSVDQLAQFGIIIWPGGSGSMEIAGITAATQSNVMQAVMDRGVSYIGFCAGAFLAVGPVPAAGKAPPSYALPVVNGAQLNYYYLENQGTDIAMTQESFADGVQRNILWYGGPVTPSGTGVVVAKYPTGEPAISELWSGKGYVMLSGVHPSIPAADVQSLGVGTPDATDPELTWTMISSTLDQTGMATF